MSSYSTPFFLFDLDRIRVKYDEMSRAFPGASIHYAVKANNNKQVLLTLISAGSKFEVGSKQEAEMMMELGVPPGHLIFSAPVKLPSHIRDTYQEGVDLFAFDSEEELNKLALLAPGSRVLLRLAVGNEGSLFPLSLKFGVPPEEALYLMERARDLGLYPYGLAFHVGSQCERKETWREAMETSSEVWGILERKNIALQCLNIGGGFPISYIHKAPSIEEIACEVLKVLNDKFPSEVKLIIEPGRYIVGEAAILVSTVIGKARRGDKNWLYLDVGAINGLFEAIQVEGEFLYRVKTTHSERPEKQYVLAGPTCDPDDNIRNEVWLPEVEVGDKVDILNTGAYSFVYASSFSGFSVPEIRFTSERKEITDRGVEKEYEHVRSRSTSKF